MVNRLFALGYAAALALLVGCTESSPAPSKQTGLLVVITSDLEPRWQLDHLKIETVHSNGTRHITTVAVVDDPRNANETSLPCSFAVYPNTSGASSSVKISISGFDATSPTPVVRRQAEVSFVHQTLARLVIPLTQACIDRYQLCESTLDKQTCSPSGCCVSPALPPEGLDLTAIGHELDDLPEIPNPATLPALDPLCQVPCNSGSTRCKNGMLFQCQSNDWLPILPCTNGCSTNEIHCNHCTEDETTCSDGILMRCIAGDFEEESSCEYGCTDQGSQCRECAPGEQRCSATQQSHLLACSADGLWEPSARCYADCEAAAPQTFEETENLRATCTACQPDSRRCDGDAILICSQANTAEALTCHFGCDTAEYCRENSPEGHALLMNIL